MCHKIRLLLSFLIFGIVFGNLSLTKSENKYAVYTLYNTNHVCNRICSTVSVIAYVIFFYAKQKLSLAFFAFASVFGFSKQRFIHAFTISFFFFVRTQSWNFFFVTLLLLSFNIPILKSTTPEQKKKPYEKWNKFQANIELGWQYHTCAHISDLS